MRYISPVAASLALLLMSGCATSADPAKGGFLSGVNGLSSGGYKERVRAQGVELAQVEGERRAAEASAASARAELAAREQTAETLRRDIAGLDRALRDDEALAARQSGGNAALARRNRQLAADLAVARKRLAVLQKPLPAGADAADYDAMRREYSSLQAAIAALHAQLKGESR